MGSGKKNNHWNLKRFQKNDTEKLAEFRKIAYGGTNFVSSEYIKWQFEDNPAGRAIGWMAINERNDILGEYWIVPVRFKTKEGTGCGSVGANALIHPAHRRKNIFTGLGEKCAEDCVDRSIKYTVYMPNHISMKGLIRKLNCRDMGEVPFLLFPVNIRKLVEYKFHSKLMRYISALAIEVFHRCSRKSDENKGVDETIYLSHVNCLDHDYDYFWKNIKDKYPCMTVRDSAYMNWRYAPLPKRKYDIYIAKAENEMLGYIIVRTAIIENLEAGFIIDYMVESTPEGRSAGMKLVDMVINRFVHENVHLICSLALPHTEEYSLLRDNGFLVCPRFLKPHPFHFVAQIHDADFDWNDLCELKNWFWTLGDYDIL
jgi:hypothetical protein